MSAVVAPHNGHRTRPSPHSLDNARILVNANEIASALKYVTISVNAFAFFMKYFPQ